jgi:hypothetical protein
LMWLSLVVLSGSGLAEALEQWPGVLSVALKPLPPPTGPSNKQSPPVAEAVVLVRYEQELVGLRDLLHAMDSQVRQHPLTPFVRTLALVSLHWADLCVVLCCVCVL